MFKARQDPSLLNDVTSCGWKWKVHDCPSAAKRVVEKEAQLKIKNCASNTGLICGRGKISQPAEKSLLLALEQQSLKKLAIVPCFFFHLEITKLYFKAQYFFL